MGSTIITTQLRKKALKSVIDESPIRDALADRLFRDCDIEITLKGTSWRGSNKELEGEKKISDTDVKTIINAALKKDFPLSSERLLQLVNSDLSTYELLDIVCDFINSLGTISKGKDAELLCKLKAKNKKLEEENKQLTANYNEAMLSLLKEKESVVSMEKEKGGHLLRINMLECDVDSLKSALERARLLS